MVIFAHPGVDSGKRIRDDSVQGGMLRKGLLKKGRNEVSANAPSGGRCNPWGDRLTNLGDLQFMLYLFQGQNKGKNFLLSVGLFNLWGKEGFAETDKAVMLFFFGGKLAVVIFNENFSH
ncbi:hypothetical protein AK812_SmicGene43429 [Symbiodinium microadriaticum]|uniref:Uncharacterized protein n=1 Tax=Symbiodinium microadriaticum TaxID=2951 RepID=A0A1Q9C122_SYMMI|nr:hypothetical protein AK812_SmicGene43429 [Symbiodinium microadriaticum]